MNWFWKVAITTPKTKSTSLIVQCKDPAIPGQWCAWLEENVHVIGALVGDVPLNEAKEVLKNAMTNPMPHGLSPRALKDCTHVLAEGVPVWVVFEMDYHRKKWEREDKKKADTQAEKDRRQEQKEQEQAASPLVGWGPLMHAAPLSMPPPQPSTPCSHPLSTVSMFTAHVHVTFPSSMCVKGAVWVTCHR